MMPPIAACQIPVVEGTEENAFRPGPILCSYVSTLFVISSTPKVAIPAARPESRISGRPTANAKIPPITGGGATRPRAGAGGGGGGGGGARGRPPTQEREEGASGGKTGFPARDGAEGPPRSSAVPGAPAAREEPVRPDEQDDDHRREEKAR